MLLTIAALGIGGLTAYLAKKRGLETKTALASGAVVGAGSAIALVVAIPIVKMLVLPAAIIGAAVIIAKGRGNRSLPDRNPKRKALRGP